MLPSFSAGGLNTVMMLLDCVEAIGRKALLRAQSSSEGLKAERPENGGYLRMELMRMMTMRTGASQRTMKLTIGKRRVATVPSLVTSLRKVPFGANQPMNTTEQRAHKGRIQLVANVSRKLKIVKPKIFIFSRLPNDSEHNALITNSGHIMINVAARRERLKRFCTNDIETSEIEIVLVNAATSSNVKKRIDQYLAPGICANTSGSVTNTRVVPRKESR